MDRIQLDELPDYHPFPYAIPGSFSVQLGRGKDAKKYIKSDTSITIGGETETPPYHFRKTLSRIVFPKGKPFETPTYPYLAIPRRLPYAYYIDIRKAYLQIASVYGAQCYVQPGRICGYGEYNFSDELFITSKVARGLIITGTDKKGMFTEWNGQRLTVKRFQNGMYAPHLRGAVMCTLHALFAELQRYSVYIHTDGIVIPEWYLSKAESILSQWGLTHAIKAEGYCHIVGVGAYQIGSKSTLTYQRRLSVGMRSNIQTELATWWKRVFIRGVEHRIRTNTLLSLD